MALKQLAVLGSTGSIGVTTLDLVARFPDRFRAVALAAGRNVERLAEQVRQFQPRLVATADAQAATALRAAVPEFRGEILAGLEGIEQVAIAPEVDLVISALVGALGLRPTLRAATRPPRAAMAPHRMRAARRTTARSSMAPARLSTGVKAAA